MPDDKSEQVDPPSAPEPRPDLPDTSESIGKSDKEQGKTL